MAKKKDKNNKNIFYAILIIIALILLLQKGCPFTTQSLLNGTNSGSEYDQYIENTDLQSEQCGLTMSTDQAEVGTTITGTIYDGKNTPCAIYVNYENQGWHLYKTVMTSALGTYTESVTVNQAGTYQFGAVCGKNGQFCTTNQPVVEMTQQQQQDKYYCCQAMGVKACYQNGCPPAGILVYQDFFNTVDQCAVQCNGAPAVQAINTIFISGGSWTGPMGGMAGADAKCSFAAQTAGLTGTWISILSTSVVSAKTRLQMNDGPYFDMKGNKVADNTADLFDGTLDGAIIYNENGNSVGNVQVWTGTVMSGDSSALTCHDWSWVDETAMYGKSNVLTSWWIADGIDKCSVPKRIYCVKTSMVLPD